MTTIFIFGLIAGGVGTAIGCLIGWLMFRLKGTVYGWVSLDRNTLYALLYEFSSGLMMGIVTFHLLPEAINMSGLWLVLTGVFLGFCFLYLGDLLLKKIMRIKTTGLLMSLGIMLHNLPEGMAIGTTAVHHDSYVLPLVMMITLHDIPEGISAFFTWENKKLSNVIWLLFWCGVPTGVFSVLGNVVGGRGLGFHGTFLGVASGAMLYILLCELSREAHQLSERKITDGMYIVGLIMGILLK